MTAESKKILNKFSIWLGCGIFVASILMYWFGLNLLKVEVFPHYFNPEKHVIVKQNPDTKEIYAWKDANGIYTPEDAHVKNFTWGTTALLLFIMIFSIAVYNLAVKHYNKVLLEKETKPGHGNIPKLRGRGGQ